MGGTISAPELLLGQIPGLLADGSRNGIEVGVVGGFMGMEGLWGGGFMGQGVNRVGALWGCCTLWCNLVSHPTRVTPILVSHSHRCHTPIDATFPLMAHPYSWHTPTRGTVPLVSLPTAVTTPGTAPCPPHPWVTPPSPCVPPARSVGSHCRAGAAGGAGSCSSAVTT